MSDLDAYSSHAELELYREYREIAGQFRFAVETERRFYLANDAQVKMHTSAAGDVFFEVILKDAWAWDVYRQSRFVRSVRVVTFKDVNVEEISRPAQ